MDCIAIGAHPDDVELFAGGFLALCAQRGYRIGIVHLTRGERGTRGSPDERRTEALAAAEALSIPSENVAFLDLGDALLDNTEDNRLEIVRVLRRWRPRFVLHHNPFDRHPDHRKACRLVEEAFFYSHLAKIETDAPPHAPTGRFMFLNNSHAGQIPAFIVDISGEVFERKMAAIRAYRSQFHNPDRKGEETYISSMEFLEQIEVRARYFGGMIGAKHGEAFQAPEPLAFSDPSCLIGAREE
ncbi:bacillithiol biosynthesis deacetylase BshB1 [Candidatus Sumerlaeota bacterium]|nr:bacillithiol biosynthesis deacetylase BshB1 [Candidatus Sumerlaeota bacterium]